MGEELSVPVSEDVKINSEIVNPEAAFVAQDCTDSSAPSFPFYTTSCVIQMFF